MNEQEGPALILAREATPDVAKQVLAVAQTVDSMVIPTRGISKRQFLRLIAGVVALPLDKKDEASAASLEPSLPLPVALMVPPLLAFVNQPGLTPQQRERRGCIALVLAGAALVLTPLGIYTAFQGRRVEQKQKADDNFKKLPLDQQVEARRRQEAEKDSAYIRYKEGVYLVAFGPFDINHPIVQQLFGELGPTWMFAPERKNELKQWFGRDFTDQEIEQFRINPQTTSEFTKLLKALQAQGKVSQQVVDFYSQPREKVLKELREKYNIK